MKSKKKEVKNKEIYISDKGLRTKDQSHPSSFTIPPSSFNFRPLSFNLSLSNFSFQLFAFLLFFFFSIQLTFAQNVSINTDGSAPDGSAMLDVSDTTRGFLPPRLSRTQMNNISSPAEGLLIYNTTDSSLYYFDGISWAAISAGVFEKIGGLIRDTTSDYSSDFVIGSPQLDDSGIPANDSRLFFDKSKGAFRAGAVEANEWDQLNIGDYTTAFGFNNTVSQIYGFASGNGNTVSGWSATATGFSNTVIGGSSLASGSLNTIDTAGASSFVAGSGNTIKLYDSFTAGYFNTNQGARSHSLGNFLLTKSYSEIVLGIYNEDYTADSVRSVSLNDRLFVIGNGTDGSNRSNALTILKNGNSFFNGQLTISNGTDSITFPNTDGTNGQVLQTDGSGNIGWASASSASFVDADGDTRIQVEEAADEDFIRFDIAGNEAMVLDTLGNLSIGTPPAITYQKLSISTNVVGGNLRLNQETDTLGAEVGFFDRDVFKWSLGGSGDDFTHGESFYLYNNDRGRFDFLVDGDFGYFGINTTAPASRFHANSTFGSFKVNDYTTGTASETKTILMGTWEGYNNSPQVRFTDTATANFFDIGLDSNQNFIIQPDDNNLFTFRKEGWMNVGYDTVGFRLFLGDQAGGNTFARIHTRNAQSGLWVSNDSSGWALFSDNPTSGGLMQPGAVGLFMTNGGGLAWTVTKEGKMGIGTPNTPALELSIGPVDDDTGFETNSDGVLSLFTNGTESVTFTDSLVGIGKTVPRKELDVYGSIIASSKPLTAIPNGLDYTLMANNNGVGLLASLKGFTTLPLDLYAKYIDFKTGASNFSNPVNMRLDSTGDLGVGTTSPAYKLHVFEDFSSGHVMTIENGNTGSNADGLRIVLGNASNPSSSNNYITMYNQAGGNIVGQIEGNSSANVVYGGSSDRRLKTKIENFESGLATLEKIHPKIYERKNNLGTKEIGFIAQDLQGVYPQMVAGDSTLNEITNPMMVDYGKLTPVLAAGIKELDAKVKDQAETIQALMQALDLKQTEIELLKKQNQKNQENFQLLKAEVEQIQQSRIR